MKSPKSMSYNNTVSKVLITGGSGFIGTNLIMYLLDNYPNYELINLDSSPPRFAGHNQYWKECDVKNKDLLLYYFNKYNPHYVIHLAAKASLKGKTIDDFPDNITGTQNIVNAVAQTPSVLNFLHTSTQYVNTPGILPSSEIDYHPYTPYGASKAESERIVRNANLKCNWVILRPTNIWGPWHSFFPYELWPYLSKRLFLHPGFKPISKHYGFIGNAVGQIAKILHQVEDQLLNQVYYITDPPIDSAEWMGAFSKALCGKSIRRIPKIVWKSLAVCGDLMQKMSIPFPVDSERYFRLTVNERLPYEKIIDLAGSPEINLEQGVQISLKWLGQYHPNLLRNSN